MFRDLVFCLSPLSWELVKWRLTQGSCTAPLENRTCYTSDKIRNFPFFWWSRLALWHFSSWNWTLSFYTRYARSADKQWIDKLKYSRDLNLLARIFTFLSRRLGGCVNSFISHLIILSSLFSFSYRSFKENVHQLQASCNTQNSQLLTAEKDK